MLKNRDHVFGRFRILTPRPDFKSGFSGRNSEILLAGSGLAALLSDSPSDTCDRLRAAPDQVKIRHSPDFKSGFRNPDFRDHGSKFGKSVLPLGACCAAIGQPHLTHAIGCEWLWRSQNTPPSGLQIRIFRKIRISNPENPDFGADFTASCGALRSHYTVPPDACEASASATRR